MRVRILVLLITSILTNNILAQNKPKSQSVKIVYSPVSLQVNYKANYFLSKGKSDLDMNTKFGHGIELLLKTRVSKNYFFDVGFHALSYKIDTATLYKKILNDYYFPGYYTSMKTFYSTGNMSQVGFSTSLGKNILVLDFHLEPYVKLAISLFSYNTQSVVYVRNKTTNELNFYSIDGRKSNTSLLPAIGLNGYYKLTRLLYLSLGIETGYLIGRHQILSKQTNQDDKMINGVLAVATPKYFIGGHLGLILKPFNKLRDNEWKYNDENYLKNKEIGN